MKKFIDSRFNMYMYLGVFAQFAREIQQNIRTSLKRQSGYGPSSPAKTGKVLFVQKSIERRKTGITMILPIYRFCRKYVGTYGNRCSCTCDRPEKWDNFVTLISCNDSMLISRNNSTLLLYVLQKGCGKRYHAAKSISKNSLSGVAYFNADSGGPAITQRMSRVDLLMMRSF